MRDVVCFNFNGTQFCIRIPVLVNKYWWLDDPNPPDPLHRVEFEDLRVLATINELASTLSVPALSRELHAATDIAMDKVVAEMPAGTTLHSAKAPEPVC